VNDIARQQPPAIAREPRTQCKIFEQAGLSLCDEMNLDARIDGLKKQLRCDRVSGDDRDLVPLARGMVGEVNCNFLRASLRQWREDMDDLHAAALS
jgi:hypothetical protein